MCESEVRPLEYKSSPNCWPLQLLSGLGDAVSELALYSIGHRTLSGPWNLSVGVGQMLCKELLCKVASSRRMASRDIGRGM